MIEFRRSDSFGIIKKRKSFTDEKNFGSKTLEVLKKKQNQKKFINDP